MSIRLVDKGWERELSQAMRECPEDVFIICPFIKAGTLSRLLSKRTRNLQVITRFNLSDFEEGVSDLQSLRILLNAKAKVRGIRNLHAKLYLFGQSRAIVTSANLTDAALSRNHEFGLVADSPQIVASCRAYFQTLWEKGQSNLALSQVAEWEGLLAEFRASAGKTLRRSGLRDFGKKAGIPELSTLQMPDLVSNATQAFVKFLGEGNNRKSLATSVVDEIRRSDCHRVLTYPATKRPTGVIEGAVMFIGRLTHTPNDIRVFGRAIGMKHDATRDNALPSEFAKHPWKEKWSRYIRVHHTEFVNGTMSNGVSLNQLMEDLKERTFSSTQRNAVKRSGNINPRRAYSQQAAVELSSEGLAELNKRLQEKFEFYGKLPRAVVNKL
jgi:hypothetical protein